LSLKTQLQVRTSAFFEPSNRLCDRKRSHAWKLVINQRALTEDLELSYEIGSREVIVGIGRNFQEVLAKKPVNPFEIKRNGLGADGKELKDQR